MYYNTRMSKVSFAEIKIYDVTYVVTLYTVDVCSVPNKWLIR